VPDSIEAMRARVLAIHRPEEVYTIETHDLETGEVTEHAILDDDGNVLVSSVTEVWCGGCDVRWRKPWPCETVRAVMEEWSG
jgi:hypothetical protein